MKILVQESLVELLALLGSAVGTVVLSGIGMLAEQAAIQNVLAGQTLLGAWEAWMGSAVLFGGLYLLGYREFWFRLRRFVETSRRESERSKLE